MTHSTNDFQILVRGVHKLITSYQCNSKPLQS